MTTPKRSISDADEITFAQLWTFIDDDFDTAREAFAAIYLQGPCLTTRQELAARFIERMTWISTPATISEIVKETFELVDAILADGKEAGVADINPAEPPDLQIINPGPKWEDVELLGGKLGEYPQRARTVDKDGKTYVEVQIDIPRRPSGHMFKEE